MVQRPGLASFLAVAAVLTSAVWSWSAGAPGVPLPIERAVGALPLAGAPEGPTFSPGINDTFYFGGTTWAADSARWEALPDSVWTFESGVGSSFSPVPHLNPFKPAGLHTMMEGWIGLDLTYRDLPYFRRIISSCAASGTASMWAGVTQAEAEALCWPGGQGYGNNWFMCINHDTNFSHVAGLVASLTYDYLADTEPGYDYQYLVVDTTGALDGSADVVAFSTTGPASGTAHVTLTEGVNMRRTNGAFNIKFCVFSDGGYSDEDGIYTTVCGALALDNIVLKDGTTTLHTANFEIDSDGWILSDPVPGAGGDWSDILSVSALPWPPGYSGDCALGDSVLVFCDPSTGGHPLYQDNIAVSPWIDLKAAAKTGLPGRFIELGGYYDLPLTNYLFVQTLAQWYPDTCATTGRVLISSLRSNGFVRDFGGYPVCAGEVPRRIDFTDVIPSTAEQVRIAVGVLNYCRFYSNCTNVTNSTPWFNDIRFGVTTTDRIQNLVDAAAPGDTVLVGAGVYWGPGNRDITFRGKEIVLLAPAGPVHTIIDCQGAARGFIIDSGEDSTLVIDGFTVRNGKAPTLPDYPYLDNGGAVLVSGLANPTFKNCRLESSLAHAGGGIYVGAHCGIRVEGCVLEADSVTTFEAGAGVHGAYPSTVTILGSVIQGNRRGFGIQGYGTTYLDSCHVEGNAGSGVHVDGDGWVRDCTITGNGGEGLQLGHSTQWGWGGSAIAQRCMVTGNGGAGIVGAGELIETCSISGNGSSGVVVAGTVIRDCMIEDNDGTGVDMLAGLLEGCRISGNAGGGAVAQCDIWSASCPTLKDCVVSGNHGSGVTFGPGGGILELGWMIGCTVSGNHATIGGGVWARADQVDISRSIIQGNCADSLGAEVYADHSSAAVSFNCCAIDTIGVEGPGTISYNGPQVFIDPLFCSAASCYATPTTVGDYHLAAGSPCLPESSPCDSLIGALGMGCSTTGVPDDRPSLPLTASLRAFPNPFRADVTFVVGVPAGTTGTIEIFEVRGRRIRAFEARAGETALRWDGRSEQGVSLPQGLYFVRLRAGAEMKTQRVILIR